MINGRAARLRAAILATCALCSVQAQTDQDVVHARLQKHADLFRGYATSRRLENTKPNAEGAIDLSFEMHNDYAMSPVPVPATVELVSLGHLSNAVIVGTAVRQYSALTPQHSFVYSDWVFNVTKVIKNVSEAAVFEGGEITVSRPGGELTVNGQRVIAHDRAFPEFVIGHRYALFLPETKDHTSSFRAIAGGAFDVTAATPALVADPRDPTALRAFAASMSSEELIETIERSANQ